MAAVPSPAAAPRVPVPPRQPGREPPGARGAELQVVPRPRHTARFAVLFGLVIVTAVFGTVALHAMAAGAAFDARALEAEVEELSSRHQELTAAVARLESPDRIRDVATGELGMVPAEQPRYVYLGETLPGFDGPGDPRFAESLQQLLAER